MREIPPINRRNLAIVVINLLFLASCRTGGATVSPLSSALTTQATGLPTRIVITVPPPTTIPENQVRGTVVSQHPSLSQIGGKVAYATNASGVFEIGILDMNSGKSQILTSSPNPGDAEPFWSVDGKHIVFNSGRSGNNDLEVYMMNYDGTNQHPVTVQKGKGGNFSPALSPDGTRVLYQSNRDGNMEVYIANVNGSDEHNLTNNPSNDITPAWSPDGSHVIFASDRSGSFEIYTMNPDGSDVKPFYSRKGYVLIRPRYSPDGKMILFGIQVFGSLDYNLAVVNADGSELHMVTSGHGQYTQAAWVGDDKIIYSGRQSDGERWQLYVVGLDGSNPVQVTSGNADYRDPYWVGE